VRFISTTLTIVRVPHGGVGGRIRRDLQAEQGGHYWGTLVESGIFSVVRHPIILRAVYLGRKFPTFASGRQE